MSSTARSARNKTRMLTEGALMVALAQVLSFVKLLQLPNGGSLTPAMFPLLLFALRWGVRGGTLAAAAFGLLQLLMDGAYAWGWQSMVLDYLLAFAPLGLAGLFRGKKWGIFAGTVVGCLGRFAIHFLSGITIYRIVVPTAVLGTVFDEPWLYSLAYNGSYMLPNTLLALAMAALLYPALGSYYRGTDIR